MPQNKLYGGKDNMETILKGIGIEIGFAPVTYKSRALDKADTFTIEYNCTDSPLRDNAFLKSIVRSRKKQIMDLFEKTLDAYCEE